MVSTSKLSVDLWIKPNKRRIKVYTHFMILTEGKYKYQSLISHLAACSSHINCAFYFYIDATTNFANNVVHLPVRTISKTFISFIASLISILNPPVSLKLVMLLTVMKLMWFKPLKCLEQNMSNQKWRKRRPAASSSP